MGTHCSLLPCRMPRTALRLLPFCESTAQVAEAVNLNFTCGPFEFGRPAAYTESRSLKTTPSPLRAWISANALRLPDSVPKALMICMPAPVADLRLASNGTVRYANDWMRATRSAVDTLQAEGPLAIVCYGSVVTWRQISY